MRRILALLAFGTLAVTLAACSTGGADGGASSPAATGTTSSPTPTATAAASPSADVALPERCEDIYSAEMLAQLQEANPPLNDPGVTMTASGVEAAFTALEEAAADGRTIRCTWGTPSEYGLATNVTLVAAEQADEIREALEASGMDCAPSGEGTLCRIVVESAEEESGYGGYTWGETHYFADNGWVATGWLNFGPEGYTDDIVATLWG